MKRETTATKSNQKGKGDLCAIQEGENGKLSAPSKDEKIEALGSQ